MGHWCFAPRYFVTPQKGTERSCPFAPVWRLNQGPDGHWLPPPTEGGPPDVRLAIRSSDRTAASVDGSVTVTMTHTHTLIYILE